MDNQRLRELAGLETEEEEFLIEIKTIIYRNQNTVILTE